MAEDCSVLEFPTGRRMSHRPVRPTDRVARLVRSLSGRNSHVSTGRIVEPISIRLDALTGFDDETVEGLTTLASAGVITAACAARLAMRHAIESSRSGLHPRHPSNGIGPHTRLATTLAGDVFGDFAFHLSCSDAWLGFATWPGIPFLYEICPPDRAAICLLIGCDAARRNVVRIQTPSDWRRRLTDARAAGSREVSHHVLLLGGIPRAGEARRSVIGRLHRAVLAAGNLAVAGKSMMARSYADGGAYTRFELELLTLVEMAMPGLVELDRSRSEGDR